MGGEFGIPIRQKTQKLYPHFHSPQVQRQYPLPQSRRQWCCYSSGENRSPVVTPYCLRFHCPPPEPKTQLSLRAQLRLYVRRRRFGSCSEAHNLPSVRLTPFPERQVTPTPQRHQLFIAPGLSMPNSSFQACLYKKGSSFDDRICFFLVICVIDLRFSFILEQIYIYLGGG